MTGGFFAVLDDIALLLDDAAAMSKVAARETVGILGDDLAINAEKASGLSTSRELPVLWAITKGSLRNKLIILPFAFLLSAFATWIIIPILVMGGLYLSHEGCEKILDYFHNKPKNISHIKKEALSEDETLIQEERKIKSAILTDFILSIEIIVMALGVSINHSLTVQIIAVTFVAFLATGGVYGIVAIIVRMDDLGFYLIRISNNKILKHIGGLLVKSLPLVIKMLSVVGVIAMILVAGNIFVHNIKFLKMYFCGVNIIVANMFAGLIAGVCTIFIKKIITSVYSRII